MLIFFIDYFSYHTAQPNKYVPPCEEAKFYVTNSVFMKQQEG